MKLEHYSHHAGLDVIDPKFHGTGVRGEESKRKLEPHWQDRSYHYLAGTQPESTVGAMPHKYQSEVPDENIYDYQRDPKNLKQRSMWGPSLDRNLYEKNIKEAGYHGYINRGAPGMGTVVALFHPVKAQSVMKKSEDLSKGKNSKEQKKEIFGTDPNGPRISEKRMKMMNALKDYAKKKYGLDMEVAAGKRDASGEIRAGRGDRKPYDVFTQKGHAQEKAHQTRLKNKNAVRVEAGQKPIKEVDPKPDWQSGKLETQPSPDAAVHEIAHLIHEKGGQDLPEMQRRMDVSWGESQKKYGHMQQKKTEGEIQPMAMENPIRRRVGLPATAPFKNPRPMSEHDRPVEQAVDNTGPRFTRGVKPGKDPKSVDYDRSSRLLSPEHKEKFDQVDRGELKFVNEPGKGWVPGTSPNAKINQRARAASKDPTRKDAKTLMRSDAPHAPESPEDKAHDVIEEGQPLQSAMGEVGKSNIGQMLAHLRTLQNKMQLRSKANEAVGADVHGKIGKSEGDMKKNAMMGYGVQGAASDMQNMMKAMNVLQKSKWPVAGEVPPKSSLEKASPVVGQAPAATNMEAYKQKSWKLGDKVLHNDAMHPAHKAFDMRDHQKAAMFHGKMAEQAAASGKQDLADHHKVQMNIHRKAWKQLAPSYEGPSLHKSITEDLQKKQGIPAGANPAKVESCVKQVKAQGHDKSSAFAICNAAKAGQ